MVEREVLYPHFDRVDTGKLGPAADPCIVVLAADPIIIEGQAGALQTMTCAHNRSDSGDSYAVIGRLMNREP